MESVELVTGKGVEISSGVISDMVDDNISAK
jgi:hypothetical protein